MAAFITLTIPAQMQYLPLLGHCVRTLVGTVEGLEDADITAHDIHLAVHEACTNIVEHAYAGTSEGEIGVVLRFDPKTRAFTAELEDTGRAFDMGAVPEPDLDEPQVRGYGLFLIRSLMDDVSYQPQDVCNRWRLVKQL